MYMHILIVRNECMLLTVKCLVYIQGMSIVISEHRIIFPRVMTTLISARMIQLYYLIFY